MCRRHADEGLAHTVAFEMALELAGAGAVAAPDARPDGDMSWRRNAEPEETRAVGIDAPAFKRLESAEPMPPDQFVKRSLNEQSRDTRSMGTGRCNARQTLWDKENRRWPGY